MDGGTGVGAVSHPHEGSGGQAAGGRGLTRLYSVPHLQPHHSQAWMPAQVPSSEERMRKRQCTVALVLLLGTAAISANAREDFEGIWAKTDAECQDEEGPNSRTLIDMRDPKTGPLYVQYENHCRIMDVGQKSGSYILRLTCFEFWEDFEKQKNPRNTMARITLRGPQSILIDGSRYVRCIR